MSAINILKGTFLSSALVLLHACANSDSWSVPPSKAESSVSLIENKISKGNRVTFGEIEKAYKDLGNPLYMISEVRDLAIYSTAACKNGSGRCNVFYFKSGVLISGLEGSRLDAEYSEFKPESIKESQSSSHEGDRKTMVKPQSPLRDLDGYKEQCTQLGFKVKTKEFGACVFELMR